MKKENILTAMSVKDKFKIIRKGSNMSKMLNCQKEKLTKMTILKRYALDYHSEYIKSIYEHYIVYGKSKEEFV